MTKRLTEWPTTAIDGKWGYYYTDNEDVGIFIAHNKSIVFKADSGVIYFAVDFNPGEYFEEVVDPNPDAQLLQSTTETLMDEIDKLRLALDVERETVRRLKQEIHDLKPRGIRFAEKGAK